MRLRSTTADFRRLALLPTAAERRAAWPAYEATAPDVFTGYFGGWASRSRIDASAETASELLADLDDREARAVAACQRAEETLRDAGLLGPGPGEELDVVLLVGVGASNGWVHVVDGRPTLHLALEVLPAAPYDVVLAVHEVVHVVTARRRPDGPWPDDVAAAVVDEGLATALSRRLVPGLDDSGYLWFDDAHAGWVEECERAQVALRQGVVSAMADGSRPEPLFSLGADSPLPPRGGYWLADRFGQEVLERHDAAEVVGWTYDRGRAVVAAALAS